MRFVKAVLAAMLARKSGKIIAVTNAEPLRPLPAIDGVLPGEKKLC